MKNLFNYKVLSLFSPTKISKLSKLLLPFSPINSFVFFLGILPLGESPTSSGRRVLFDYPGSPYLYGNYHHPSPSEDMLLWFGGNSSGMH